MSPAVRKEREADVAAQIALWIAIHGGDPAHTKVVVDDTALLIAAALDRHLATTIEGADREGRGKVSPPERLKSLGIERVDDEGGHGPEYVCFCFRWVYFGVIICVCFRRATEELA
jgi:hypothetical protein